MRKRYSAPDNHWNWPIKVKHYHGVRCGSMIWIGGQCDLNPAGKVQNPGNLPAQIKNSMAYFERVLQDLDCDFDDLVTLLCFYVNDGSLDEAEFLQRLGACLPPTCRTAVNAIPVLSLACPGLLVEIEGCAMRRQNGQRCKRTYSLESSGEFFQAPFVSGLRCDKMIFISAQSPLDDRQQIAHAGDVAGQTERVAENLRGILNQFGATFDDVVKTNRWYVGQSGIGDFEAAALAFAKNFTEPGPAATGIPLPRHADPDVLIKIGLVAMLGLDGASLPREHAWPESLWDWHVHLPYKHGIRCEEMIFLGGQVSLDKRGQAVHPDNLTAQTHQAMQHIGTILDALGAGYDDVCKITSVYCGSSDAHRRHENLSIRSAYFPDLVGPAATDVPLPELAYDSMVIEIDTFAMAD